MKKRTYILVIEDSPSQALRLQLLLKRAGYEVQVARDGAEGWHHACNTHPQVILLDVNLPIIDGFRVLSLLKQGQRTAGIPVVMLSSLDSVSDVEEAVMLGADGYLFKDDCLFRRDGVTQIIDTVNQFLQVEAA